MCKHENKYCPRCNQPFECKTGSILQCQCYGFQFTEEEKAFIEKEFLDCLCASYLQEIKKDFSLQTKLLPLKKIV